MDHLLQERLRPAELAANRGLERWHLVDVRTPAEFEEAHIEGSVNVPLGGFGEAVEHIQTRSGKRPVLLICRTGRRAEAAAEKLTARGVGGSRVLEGGILAWEAAFLPLRRGRKAFSIERQVRVAAGALVLLGVLLGFLLHPLFFGLSGFVGAGLMFAGLTDTCGMALFLARMPWNSAPASCSRE